MGERDKDIVSHREEKEMTLLTRELRHFFKLADKDKNGTVSLQEFRSCLESKKVYAHFKQLGLDINNVRSVYALLDETGHGEVNLEQFVAGVHRLRGAAKSADVCKVLMAVQDMHPRIEEISDRLD